MKVNTAVRQATRAVILSALSAALILGVGRQTTSAGIAQNFTIVNHANGMPLSLTDYQGSVILLDFWAYWCEYCQQAASDIEPNIADYYAQAGGNRYGVPVTVLCISIDGSDPQEEDAYIQTYGLGLVADDPNWAAYNQFNLGGIPLFVVINGATNAVDYSPWEILYCDDGYGTNYTVPLLINYLDSVQTPPPNVAITSPAAGAAVSPPNVLLAATVTTNGEIVKQVQFYNGATLLGTATNSPYSLTWSNVSAGAKSVSARACYGTKSSANSAAVSFTVAGPVSAKMVAQGNNLVLEWSGGAGNFQVEATTNLDSGVWQKIGAAGTNTSLVITPNSRAMFYRLQWQ